LAGTVGQVPRRTGIGILLAAISAGRHEIRGIDPRRGLHHAAQHDRRARNAAELRAPRGRRAPGALATSLAATTTFAALQRTADLSFRAAPKV
jgi:hypothetical protein